MPIDPTRLDHVTRIFAAVAPHVTVTYDRGFVLSWAVRGEAQSRRWRAQRVGSDYPTWSRHKPFGGTCCRIFTQLVHWAKREPVYPLRVWRHWCGPAVGAAPEAARLAEEFGWPECVPCVLCGRVLEPDDRLDWYDLDGKRGPGCCHSDEAGCRRKKGVTA